MSQVDSFPYYPRDLRKVYNPGFPVIGVSVDASQSGTDVTVSTSSGESWTIKAGSQYALNTSGPVNSLILTSGGGTGLAQISVSDTTVNTTQNNPQALLVTGTITTTPSGVQQVSGGVTTTPSGVQQVAGTVTSTPSGTQTVAGSVGISGTATTSDQTTHDNTNQLLGIVPQSRNSATINPANPTAYFLMARGVAHAMVRVITLRTGGLFTVAVVSGGVTDAIIDSQLLLPNDGYDVPRFIPIFVPGNAMLSVSGVGMDADIVVTV